MSKPTESPLDVINRATQKYIAANSKKLVDSLFQSSPLFAAMQAEAEEDPFRDWVLEVRRGAGIDDGPDSKPRKVSFRGGVSGLAEILSDRKPLWDSQTYATYGRHAAGHVPGEDDPDLTK